MVVMIDDHGRRRRDVTTHRKDGSGSPYCFMRAARPSRRTNYTGGYVGTCGRAQHGAVLIPHIPRGRWAIVINPYELSAACYHRGDTDTNSIPEPCTPVRVRLGRTTTVHWDVPGWAN